MRRNRADAARVRGTLSPSSSFSRYGVRAQHRTRSKNASMDLDGNCGLRTLFLPGGRGVLLLRRVDEALLLVGGGADDVG
jgi:hypothetical protein